MPKQTQNNSFVVKMLIYILTSSTFLHIFTVAQVVVALKQEERDWPLAVCENSSFSRAGWGSLREEHIDIV